MGVAANLKSTNFTYLDFAKTDDTCYVSYNFLKLYIKQNTFMPIFHEFPDFYSIYNNHKVFESLCVDFYNDYIS